MPDAKSYMSFESALYQALVEAKLRGVSPKERSFIRCELLYELVKGRAGDGLLEMGESAARLNMHAELEALERAPGRPRADRRAILLAIEEYGSWKPTPSPAGSDPDFNLA